MVRVRYLYPAPFEFYIWGTFQDIIMETREIFSCRAPFLLKIGREVLNNAVNNLVSSTLSSDHSTLREELAKFGGLFFPGPDK